MYHLRFRAILHFSCHNFGCAIMLGSRGVHPFKSTIEADFPPFSVPTPLLLYLLFPPLIPPSLRIPSFFSLRAINGDPGYNHRKTFFK